jgi:hypothetical protein
VEKYTQNHPSEASKAFDEKLEEPYSEVDDWEKAYLLAKSRNQTKTADEIFEYIQEQRTAASVSSLPDFDCLVLIVLTLRHKLSQRFRQLNHLVPRKRPLSSRRPSPPRHFSSRGEDREGYFGECQGRMADRGSLQLSATPHSIPDNFSSHIYLTFTLTRYVYTQLTAKQLYWGALLSSLDCHIKESQFISVTGSIPDGTGIFDENKGLRYHCYCHTHAPALSRERGSRVIRHSVVPVLLRRLINRRHVKHVKDLTL